MTTHDEKIKRALEERILEPQAPSAGAIRAAHALPVQYESRAQEAEVARVIDRESGLGELRERAAWAVKILNDPSRYSDQQREMCARRLAGALERIEGKEGQGR